MRLFFAGLAVVVSLSGCSTLSREAGYPGGNVGFLADRFTLFASSQNQVVNRYLVSLALVTPLVEETVKSSSQAKVSSERIKELYKSIARLKAAAAKCPIEELLKDNPIECSLDDVSSEGGTAYTFESLSFEVNEALNDALKQAFDNLNLKANATKFLALEPTELLKTILKARHLIPVLLEYFATYRDVTVIVGASMQFSCEAEFDKYLKLKGLKREDVFDDKIEELRKEFEKNTVGAACSNVDEKLKKLIKRTRTADFDVAKDERPIRDVLTASKTALNVGVDWSLNTAMRTSLLQHVNRSCKRLDALAQVEMTENEKTEFKGCTVSLVKKDKKVDGDSVSKSTQKAADQITGKTATTSE